MTSHRPWLAAWKCYGSALVAVALSLPVAHAADPLRQEMAEAAKEVKKRLDDRGDKAVVMNAIEGPRKRLAASGGPVLTLYLAEELKKLGVAVKLQAAVGGGGEVRDVTDKQSKLLAAQIEIRLVDKDEEPIGAPVRRGVFGDAALSALFGVTGRMPLSLSAEERSKAVIRCLDAPAVFLKGGRVAAAADGKFAVELLVGDEPRPAEDHDGFAFVNLKRGEHYTIRLVNDADFEAAVTLRIDGVNVFAFSDLRDPDTGDPAVSAYVVPPKSSVLVRGWQLGRAEVAAFAPGGYGWKAPPYLRPAADFSTVAADFRACWPRDADPPADEPRAPAKGPGPEATRGPPDQSAARPVERLLGVEREFVSVRCRVGAGGP